MTTSASPTRPNQYGTRTGAVPAPEPGLADPAWTRLALACLVPVLLAATAPLPTWTRLALVAVLVPLTAQGWPALLCSRHDSRSIAVITLTGLAAVITVALTHDFGAAGVVMALSVPVSFVSRMVGEGGREHLVEDLCTCVTGNLVVVCAAGWCALEPGVADPAVITPVALSLVVGALLTTLRVRALVLESLTVSLAALTAGVAGGLLAMVGFFGPAHTGTTPALQSAGACLVCGFAAGVLMAASNRVLWTHRWVPGGRAAVSSAMVPVMAIGAPVYAIARLLGSFVAG